MNFFGNQYVKVQVISKCAKKLGGPLNVLSAGNEIYGMLDKDIPPDEGFNNLQALGYGAFGGPPGAILSGGYFIEGMFIPSGWTNEPETPHKRGTAAADWAGGDYW
jgi:hypothetical protein